MRLINKDFIFFNFSYVVKLFGMRLIKFVILKRNNIEFYIEKENLLNFTNILRLCGLIKIDSLNDIAVTDLVYGLRRFKLSYVYTSVFYSIRFILQIFLKELETIPSISKEFKNSNWMEREAWDLYGVFFLNHNELRRILTDYGFKGFPFRKDFPVTGYVELRYDDLRGDIVYEPVELAQEMRFFNFATGWEID